jgi:hypothetical protein
MLGDRQRFILHPSAARENRKVQDGEYNGNS